MVLRICGVPRTTADEDSTPRNPSDASKASSRISAAKRQNPALRPRHEAETMHVADRDVDDIHRPQRAHAPVERRLPAAALDQKNLMQPRMPMSSERALV
jgi:hypothetical protein